MVWKLVRHLILKILQGINAFWRKWKRLIIRIKRNKGRFIITYLSIFIRNCSYRLFSDKNFYASIQEQVEQIPDSNGCRYYEKYPFPIAIIADEFLYDSFRDIAEFIYLTPDNYEEIKEQVDFLLIVSAWRGLHNEWRQMGTAGSPANKKLYEVISAYKAAGKMIVFYSKEDPPNYQHFLPIARECDVIFTSASEKIEEYKKDCQTEYVYPLMFGINPLYHNPIGIRKFPKRPGVIFSGSWVKKYPERIKDLRMIFDGILQVHVPLKIIDRNYEKKTSTDFFFPHKYDRFISPSIPHDALQKTHKLFDWAININSVTDSHTMFANRVYELQAAGNLLLSNDSLGVAEQFKGVKIVRKKEEILSELTSYSREDIYERQVAGIRRVMTGESTFDRLKFLLTKVGYESEQPIRKVLVLMHNSSADLERQFESQTYPHKEKLSWEDVTEEKLKDFNMIALWDGTRCYGNYYLEDMINGFKYTSCDYICKDSFYIDGVLTAGTEHDYTDHVRDIFAAIFWKDTIRLADLKAAVSEGKMVKKNGYSIDHFEYQVHDPKK